MKKIKAKHLKKGDLIYVDDAYHEVVDDKLIDPPNTSMRVIKCYMSPSTPIPTRGIGTYRYIVMHEYVWLLSRPGLWRAISIAYSALKNWIATVRLLV